MTMKQFYRFLSILLIVSLLLPSCKQEEVPELPPPAYLSIIDGGSSGGNGSSDSEDEFDDGSGSGTASEIGDWNENRGKIVTPTGSGWTSKIISEGIVYYTFNGKDDVTGQSQQVFVIDLDLSNPKYKLKFTYTSPTVETSTVHKDHNSIATMNAGYEAGSIYIRVGGKNKSLLPNITIGSTGVSNWKSEGAVCCNDDNTVTFKYPGRNISVAQQRKEYMYNCPEPYLISSAPMLIYDYKPVGENFCNYNLTDSQVKKIGNQSTENFEYHQRVRHPRVAVALTENNHFIMFEVDGRNSHSKGMSARELTRFLVKHFNPQYAINMDGGGSSTLCVQGEGDPKTHVVNYPCDNKKYDHAGERVRDTHFIIVPADENE